MVPAAFAISVLTVLPIAAIVWLAATGGTENWRHVMVNVVPRATGRTVELLVFSCALTGIFGILCAWLVSVFEFPGRRLLSIALVLPLAIPSYIAAYTFGEFFDYTGPVQTGWRALFGYRTARDYAFPDIRSLGGAVLVMSAVLYPYVYLAARSMFMMQGRTAADVARTLGAGPFKVFWRVQIPMARPAIMIGLTLVMMETLNDIGAVEYLGVQTLTFSIYDTWLNRGSLAGAAQIACMMLVIVAAIMLIERAARRRQRFASQKTTANVADALRRPLPGGRKWLATAFCTLPILAGFMLPTGMLIKFALRRLDQFADHRLLDALANSVIVATAAALTCVVLSIVLVYAVRTDRSRKSLVAGRVASLGYGVPGTVLAIGVLFPFAAFDNALDGFLRDHVGLSSGLLLSGTGFAIVYAATVRFLTMAEGTVDAGFQKLSPHLDMAARTLGHSAARTLFSTLIPNLRPAIFTAALLVFIETLKELSATILLRPFNFNTLATLVYEDASRAQVEDASVAALIIVLAGLVPVLFVSRTLDGRS
nr:iron ABC transporter permease [Rhizobium halophytocola]